MPTRCVPCSNPPPLPPSHWWSICLSFAPRKERGQEGVSERNLKREQSLSWRVGVGGSVGRSSLPNVPSQRCASKYNKGHSGWVKSFQLGSLTQKKRQKIRWEESLGHLNKETPSGCGCTSTPGPEIAVTRGALLPLVLVASVGDRWKARRLPTDEMRGENPSASCVLSWAWKWSEDTRFRSWPDLSVEGRAVCPLERIQRTDFRNNLTAACSAVRNQLPRTSTLSESRTNMLSWRLGNSRSSAALSRSKIKCRRRWKQLPHVLLPNRPASANLSAFSGRCQSNSDLNSTGSVHHWQFGPHSLFFQRL